MLNTEVATAPKPKRRSRKAKPSEEAKPSPWINGRLTVSVEQHHIDESMRANSSHCAIAEAIKSTLPDATFVSVDLQSIRFSRKGLRYCVLTPHCCQSLIIGVDQADESACKPITFSMRPCTVTRAGRSKGHTPTDDELKDCGLKVASEQGHLPGENRAWQAAHKARSALIADGVLPAEADAQLAATKRGVRGPDTKPRKPRVARAGGL
jgi:hypothetical protein